MAKKKKWIKSKISLMKPGSPLPGEPKMRFVESHKKLQPAKKQAEALYARPDVNAAKIIEIPRQYAVFKESVRRSPRITPRMPRLRR